MASSQRARKPKGEKVLRPVHPSAALEIAFRQALTKQTDLMHNSVTYWTKAAYRANEPRVIELAQDETPAAALLRTIRGLKKRWFARFDDCSKKLADYFATAIKDRSDATLRKILKEGGFAVEWKMTPAMRDVMQATVGEQIGLIKSIPEKYFGQVEGAVMRSVQTGRDLKQLTDDIEKIGGVTRRRATFIARDQSNKATATMTRVRMLEAGIDTAVWLHSHAGKVPRKTHVAMSGHRFKISEGMFDSDEGRNVLPGELIRCRCSSKPVVKGFS